MKCINCQSLSSPLLLSEHRYTHQTCLTNKPCILQVKEKRYSSLSLRTRALLSPIFLATTPPAAGKLSVLLQTSAVCLFAYWIANFIVPEFILKDFQSNKTNEDGENPAEDER